MTAQDRPRPNTSARGLDLVDRPDGLLRRHVRRRAQHAAGLRDATPAPAQARISVPEASRRGRRSAWSRACRLEDLGQPPVHDLDLAERADHHVGRLQVAVDDAVGVGVADRLADLLEDGQEPAAAGGRAAAAPQQVRRGSAPLMSFMARNGRPSGRVPSSWTAGMPGCCELAGDPGLVAEAAGRCGVGGVLVAAEHLDGDLAVQRGVAGAVDDAHAAAGDLVEEFVARRAATGPAVSTAMSAGRPPVWATSSPMAVPFPVLQRWLAVSANSYSWILPTSRRDFRRKCRNVTLIDESHFSQPVPLGLNRKLRAHGFTTAFRTPPRCHR